MPEFTLIKKSPLGRFSRESGGLTISEITDRAIVSIAIPNRGKNSLSKAIASAYKTVIPAVGRSTISKVANGRFLGMQQDQLFLMFNYSGRNAVGEVEKKLGNTAYLTDQTDSWVNLCLSGTKSGAVLERICLIDLHPSVFPKGRVTRTNMEHMAAIILHESPGTFLLLSPCSSAKSFLHALETSVHNVL